MFALFTEQGGILALILCITICSRDFAMLEVSLVDGLTQCAMSDLGYKVKSTF